MQECLREIGSAVLTGRTSLRGCKYEDPLDVLLRPPVEATAFDLDRLPTPLETPCLLLPKGYTPSDGWHMASYAWLPALGKSSAGKRIRWRMHSYVCAAMHGPAPAPDLLALHHPVCQRSRQCINPLHLRWGTRADNRSDIATARHLRTARLGGRQHMVNQQGATASCWLCTLPRCQLFRKHPCHAWLLRSRRPLSPHLTAGEHISIASHEHQSSQFSCICRLAGGCRGLTLASCCTAGALVHLPTRSCLLTR